MRRLNKVLFTFIVLLGVSLAIANANGLISVPNGVYAVLFLASLTVLY